MLKKLKKSSGITLIALIITTIFCYDEFIKARQEAVNCNTNGNKDYDYDRFRGTLGVRFHY